MSDKVFDLMEKMYIEFSGNFKKVDQRFEQIDQRFEQIDQRFDSLEKRQTKIEVTIENEVLEKIKVLYDDNVEIKQSLSSIEKKIDNLTDIVENHEMRIRVLEGGKRNKTV
ncbi:MAG: hypothetical protein ACYC21_14135, partial [Eubacteriales bacterium]